LIDGEKLVALDIETSNSRGSGALDPTAEGSVVALIQLAYDDGRIELHRPTHETISLIKSLIDEGYRFVIHNAAFELDWFYTKYNLVIPKLWCAMIGSQILNAGKTNLDPATLMSGKVASKSLAHLGLWEVLIEEDDDYLSSKTRGQFSHNLQAVVYRYADRAVIQKDQGTSDWLQEPLTPEQVRYAKDDVRYLIQVARNQWKFLQKFGMEAVAELEMDALVPFALMHAHGIKVDEDGWRKEAYAHGEIAKQLEEELNPKFGEELARREGQPSLFGYYVPKSFSISSPKQLANFFGLENADERVLREVKHPLIPQLLKFKESQKISNTYGDKYLAHIKSDGRIHSDLRQAATTTGRVSSSSPNNQNLPPNMLKTHMRAEEGMLVVYFDYSSVESRILAYAADDKSMIRSVNSSDVHWENAKKIFKLPPGATREGVFSVSGKSLSGNELRRMSKGVSFG